MQAGFHAICCRGLKTDSLNEIVESLVQHNLYLADDEYQWAIVGGHSDFEAVQV
jgi:hypothetical protein